MDSRFRFEQLEKYTQYPPTKHCYLDGRYFNLVLRDICPGLIEHPLKITLGHHNNVIGKVSDTSPKKNVILSNIEMEFVLLSEKYLNFIRVIVQSDKMRHSLLLLIDVPNKTAFLWNAVTLDGDDRYYKHVQQEIRKHIKERFEGEYELISMEVTVPDVSPPECKGIPGGYCNAYVLKKAIDEQKGHKFDGNHILRFVHAVEHNYKDLLTGPPDIEYFGSGLLLGGLGLGLVGGAIIGSAAASRR
jgi:hypothetical protein